MPTPTSPAPRRTATDTDTPAGTSPAGTSPAVTSVRVARSRPAVRAPSDPHRPCLVAAVLALTAAVAAAGPAAAALPTPTPSVAFATAPDAPSRYQGQVSCSPGETPGRRRPPGPAPRHVRPGQRRRDRPRACGRAARASTRRAGRTTGCSTPAVPAEKAAGRRVHSQWLVGAGRPGRRPAGTPTGSACSTSSGTGPPGSRGPGTLEGLHRRQPAHRPRAPLAVLGRRLQAHLVVDRPRGHGRWTAGPCQLYVGRARLAVLGPELLLLPRTGRAAADRHGQSHARRAGPPGRAADHLAATGATARPCSTTATSSSTRAAAAVFHTNTWTSPGARADHAGRRQPRRVRDRQPGAVAHVDVRRPGLAAGDAGRRQPRRLPARRAARVEHPGQRARAAAGLAPCARA